MSNDIAEIVKLAIAEYYTAVATRKSLHAELLSGPNTTRNVAIIGRCEKLEFLVYQNVIRFFELLVERNLAHYASVRENIDGRLPIFNRIMLQYTSSLYELEKDVRHPCTFWPNN
jgi:hypothetical protein